MKQERIIIKKAAVIGGGVIGAGWAARLSANGVHVSVYDPDVEAPRKLAAVLHNAEIAVAKLVAVSRLSDNPPQFVAEIAEAVQDAELIIESVPERIEIKQQLYATIEENADSATIIASSTSGICPSRLQEKMKHPARFLVAHPFNPVYLLPLVELVGGDKTASSTLDKAAAIYTALGMHPLRLKKEIAAFIADRLLEATWRESLWLIKDGVATTADIDNAICHGFGLRWAQMGIFETYRIAGGEGGIKHFLQQFAPTLKWPWTKLTDVPELTAELTQTIVAQSDAQSGQYSIGELARIRDDNIVAFLQCLKTNRWGAGNIVADWENNLRAQTPPLSDFSRPLRVLSRRVPKHWTDYNGHMNESRYLECFSDASDAVMRVIGADDNYVAAGHSFFTVETHIRNLRETHLNDVIFVDSMVLLADGKKLKLFHEIKNTAGDIVATGEHMLIHVSLQTRRSCLPLATVQKTAAALAAAHAKLPPPIGAGRL